MRVPFGFMAHREIDDTSDEPWRNVEVPGSDRWCVYLPHQCDTWEIAGDRHVTVSHDEAVAGLERFIEEARDCLDHLKDRESYGRWAEL